MMPIDLAIIHIINNIYLEDKMGTLKEAKRMFREDPELMKMVVRANRYD